MKVKDMENLERPGEKMMFFGPKYLSDKELVAIILKSGTREKDVMMLSEEVTSHKNGGMKWLGSASVEELMKIQGLGCAKASVIVAAIELGRRVTVTKTVAHGNIQGLKQVIEIFMARLSKMKKEVFNIVMLDAKGNIIGIDEVSVGDLTSSIVHPRETFYSAVKKSASSIICVHNHPSGDPTPSDEDIDTTKKLAKAGKILGINLLDHVVIGDGKYFSMKEKGII